MVGGKNDRTGFRNVLQSPDLPAADDAAEKARERLSPAVQKRAENRVEFLIRHGMRH